jgi:hypothetical protein
MAHERLHNSHIFTVSLEQSTERMAKRMPTQTFGYLGSNGSWQDVVLHRAVWPQGLFAVHSGDKSGNSCPEAGSPETQDQARLRADCLLALCCQSRPDAMWDAPISALSGSETITTLSLSVSGEFDGGIERSHAVINCARPAI